MQLVNILEGAGKILERAGQLLAAPFFFGLWAQSFPFAMGVLGLEMFLIQLKNL